MAISRLTKIAFLFNITMCLLFVFSNYSMWQILVGRTIQSYWNPFEIVLVFHYLFPDGTYTTVQGIFIYPNVPFVLFWVSTIINLHFLMKLKSKEKT
jgi:hypothetical protein